MKDRKAILLLTISMEDGRSWYRAAIVNGSATVNQCVKFCADSAKLETGDLMRVELLPDFGPEAVEASGATELISKKTP